MWIVGEFTQLKPDDSAGKKAHDQLLPSASVRNAGNSTQEHKISGWKSGEVILIPALMVEVFPQL
jgi:hypothetical protein